MAIAVSSERRSDAPPGTDLDPLYDSRSITKQPRLLARLGSRCLSMATEWPKFADIFSSRPVLADGAMGTVLYARGIFINRCYDELNLSDPDLILSIHEEYLQAGAEILETNTFGANRFRLARHGLAAKVAEINAAGVKLARQAVEHLKEKQAGEAWVAGSVGPLGVRLEPLGKTGLDEARAAFAEQIRALAAAGVDLLIIETMPALNEAREAL